MKILRSLLLWSVSGAMLASLAIWILQQGFGALVDDLDNVHFLIAMMPIIFPMFIGGALLRFRVKEKSFLHLLLFLITAIAIQLFYWHNQMDSSGSSANLAIGLISAVVMGWVILASLLGFVSSSLYLRIRNR